MDFTVESEETFSEEAEIIKNESIESPSMQKMIQPPQFSKQISPTVEYIHKKCRIRHKNQFNSPTEREYPIPSKIPRVELEQNEEIKVERIDQDNVEIISTNNLDYKNNINNLLFAYDSTSSFSRHPKPIMTGQNGSNV